MAIFVIGLGPGDSDLLTQRAKRFLDAASELTPHIHVRARNHPALRALPAAVSLIGFDTADDSTPDAIAQVLLDKAHTESVIYAVPGHPLLGEPSVARLLELAHAQNVPVELIDGLSLVESSLRLLQRDLLADGVQVVSADEIAGAHFPQLNPDRPALLANVGAQAQALQDKLLALYPAEHEIGILQVTTDERVANATTHSLTLIPLGALAAQDSLDDVTVLWISPAPRPCGLESFAELIAHLRAPEDGCPWDREQTPQTLRRYLLEEAYEALEAIDLDEPQRLKEELGDLLLQIVLQSQIASERGEFTLSDVIATISAKITRRHPHVFGDQKGATMQQIEENWEAIKRREKEAGAEVHSFFRDIPKGLPALTEAEDMQQRAWRVGLWNDTPEQAAFDAGAALDRWRKRQDSQALGDALFALVDQARRAGLDAESALREANQQFKARVSGNRHAQ